jgi:hypothetical protein
VRHIRKDLSRSRQALNSRDKSLSYESAFTFLHKLREAMAEELKVRVVGSEGKEAEVDSGYFGGYVNRLITKHIVLIAAFRGTRAASAGLS